MGSLAVALALAAAVAAPTAAAFGLYRGQVAGPRRVAIGRTVVYRMHGLLAGEPVDVLVQPKASEGGNCCGVQPKARFRTSATGTLTARFRFPPRYKYDCTGGGCAGQRRFAHGSRAVVEFAIVPPGGTPDSTTVAQTLRTVVVRVH